MSAGAWNTVVAVGVMTLAGVYLAVQALFRSDIVRYLDALSIARRDRRSTAGGGRADGADAGRYADEAIGGRSAAGRSNMKTLPPPGRGSRRT